MPEEQDSSPAQPLAIERPGVRIDRLGPLPLLNHFIDRLGLDDTLARFVRSDQSRCTLSYARVLSVFLRTIILEREPIYRQQETVAPFAPDAFGLARAEMEQLGDDHIGRALDRLFDADRGALLTEVVLAATRRFDIRCDEFHNDSTTIRFCGQYQDADGREIRGRTTPAITYGFSKDHRPDLKQLLLVMTTSGDGGVPMQFRCESGNASDSQSHEESWEVLRGIVGRGDFLYVADSKLCSGGAMDYINDREGRFLTVLPRSRIEDRDFRKRLQDYDPPWETVRRRRNPRREDGPPDVWRVYRDPVPSKEGWPIIWLWSNLLELKQEHSRRQRLAKAIHRLERLQASLEGPRPRRKSRQDVQQALEPILRGRLRRYIKVRIVRKDEYVFRQEKAGRPGPETRYRRKVRKRWKVLWRIDEKRISYDRISDGMYPLITNDRNLTPKQALLAHKGQPRIEKRFQQTKSVFDIAPVFLKNEGRIEALFHVYFLALLVQALIERELRAGMAKASVEALAIYPEERPSKYPTWLQVLRLFALPQRTMILDGDREVFMVEPTLTPMQLRVLELLGVDRRAYCRGA